MTDDLWFERLADATREFGDESAPARLKARTYSAVVSRMGEEGALLGLAGTRLAGSRLCVFESALALLPSGSDAQSMNPCRLCHARLLGERLDHAPIFWPGCPYSEFHNGIDSSNRT